MIKNKKRGSLIVVSGPSGAGKDTVIENLKKINSNIWLSISCTTRKKRGEEKEGIDYYFLSEEEFKKKIEENEFLEYAIYNNSYYGTPIDVIEKKLSLGLDVVLIIEVQGALKVKEIIKDAIFIFIVPPSMDELKRRLINRNTESKEHVLQRFSKAYQEINEISKYNYVVINDKIQNAVEKVNAIILAEKCRVDRIEEVDMLTSEEKIHEGLMDL